jgi:hypothetical protein
MVFEQARARLLRPAGETGAEVLEQHRDAVEPSYLARAIPVGIGHHIGVDSEHRLDRGVAAGHGFCRLRRQLSRRHLLRANEVRSRHGIVFAPFVPAHRQTARDRHPLRRGVVDVQ